MDEENVCVYVYVCGIHFKVLAILESETYICDLGAHFRGTGVWGPQLKILGL